jgi:drug/metabolite transporter (DMT)-like permease
MSTKSLSLAAFLTLLLIALMMGGNHVAARLAFNAGVDVATAVTFRSVTTALVVLVLVVSQKVPVTITRRQRFQLPAIGLLIGLQSLFLYSSVARLPVALALLAFNTYPIWTALLAWLIYGQKPERGVVLAMPVILIGLSMALDVFGARQRAHQLVTRSVAGRLRHLVDGTVTAAPPAAHSPRPTDVTTPRTADAARLRHR